MNKSRKQLDLIAHLLGEQTTLSLATTEENGQPCVAPLFYIPDDSVGDDLSLCWLSSPGSQHSRNLLHTPRAAATVYRAAQSWREIRGVQMSGPVNILTEPNGRAAIVKRYCERFKLGRVFSLAIRQSVLHVFQPEFLRYLDNSSGFRSKFELFHTPLGWSPTLPDK